MQGKGITTPLDIKPEIIPDDYTWYVTTFNDLQISRPVAEIYAPIPMSEYVAYFQVFDNLDSMQEDLKVLIGFDKEFVRIRNEELKQERDFKRKAK